MLAARLFLVASLAICLDAASLPPYIKKCKNDKTLNECIMKRSKEAIKGLIKGDAKLGIPVLEPLKIEKIEHTSSGTRSVSLNFTMNDVNIYGLQKAELLKSEMDTSKRIIKLNFLVPQMKVVANYILKGKFLVVPVTGNGKLTITIDDLNVTFLTTYTVIKKKGIEYLNLVIPGNITYTTSKVSPMFENLFNGDKNLGDNFNRLVNENWKEWDAHIGPVIAEALGQVMASIIRKATGAVPLKEIFD